MRTTTYWAIPAPPLLSHYNSLSKQQREVAHNVWMDFKPTNRQEHENKTSSRRVIASSYIPVIPQCLHRNNKESNGVQTFKPTSDFKVIFGRDYFAGDARGENRRSSPSCRAARPGTTVQRVGSVFPTASQQLNPFNIPPPCRPPAREVRRQLLRSALDMRRDKLWLLQLVNHRECQECGDIQGEGQISIWLLRRAEM